MKKLCLLFLSSLLFITETFGQLSVTTGYTPAQLAGTIVGTGVTVSNVTINAGSAAASRGKFTCAGGCNIGFGSGILLTSGGATIASSVNTGTGQGVDNGNGGDPQLNSLTTNPTQDACILEFDFSVASDSVGFRYIFASEEYSDFVGSPFNDVFGFFISGPGIVGQRNIALIPGTSTPVTINNVNNGNSGGSPSGPCTNCTYFRDNVINAFTTAYDGLTTILVAGSRVQPCETYHIKLAIADVQDHVYDSGVFLEAQSFSSLGDIPIYANGIQQGSGTTFYACTGTNVTLAVSPAPSYSWSTGETTQSITVTTAGSYSFMTALGSCFAFSSINVVFVTPTATITPLGPTSLCAGGSVSLQANPGISYLWSTGATTQTISVSTAGNYTVTVTQNPNCSAVSLPIQITVGGAVANIAGNTTLCSGSNTTLTANLGQSYLWSTGATTQAISATVSGPYTVTVTQAGGCSASATVNVTVNSLPVPNITGITSICQGTTTTLNAGVFTGYLWSTGAITANLTTGVAGTYTVTVTDANGCTGTATKIVTVNPLPTPAIAGTTAFCQGNNSILNAGAGYSSYLWSNALTTQTITVTTAGNYAVTVTNGFSCSASTSVNIVVNPNPVPNITGTTSFCQGSNTTLDAGGGYSNYLWSTGATTQTLAVSSAGTFTVTVTNANGCTGTATKSTVVNPLPVPGITGITSICQGNTTTLNAGVFTGYLWSTGAITANLTTGVAGTYTVTVTDANGCTGTATKTVTVNPLPTPAIAGTTAFCQGNNSILNAGAGYSSYLWSNALTTQTITVTAAGNYAVTVTNGFGCSASTSVNIVVNPNPVPNITGTTSFCQGANTTLDAGGGYSNYLWSTGATTQTLAVSSTGTFTVTVTNANGCTGTATKATVVNPLPVPSITGITSICQGTTTTLNAGVFTGYLWSTGAITANLTTGVAGTYTVTVTDANGCTGTATKTVTVNPSPAPTITGNTVFCQGIISTLNAGAGYSAYLWSTGAVTPTINVTTGGNYIVTVTSANGCTGSTSRLVTVNPLPTPVITGGTGICAGSSTILNAGNGYSNYSWSTGATTQTITVGSAGNYSVIVTNNNGCSNSASTVMVINPLPTPAITGVTSICQGTTTSFNAGAGYSSYLWSTGATTATITPGISGNFTVTVTDANGCTGADNIALTVNPLPTPVISGNTVFCQGNSSILNAGSGFSSYLWSTGVTTQSINVSTAGSFTVTVTNGFNCSASTNVAIVVNPLPTPVITGGTGICAGSSTILNAGNGYSNYSWSTGATTQTITVSSAGSYSVIVTNNNGCSNSANTVMIINPLPTPAIIGITSICQGTTTSFNAGAGYSSYLWSTGATTATITPGISGNYMVTVIDANGCTGADNIALTVNPLPTPVISGNTVFCQGDNTTLNAGAGYTSYIWSNNATTQTINTGSAGNYSVIVQDGNGCTASASTSIVVNPLPTPSITGTNAVCQGISSALNAGNGYVNYLWSTGENTQIINAGVAGNYTVTVTDVNGCVNSSPSFALTVYVRPDAVISTNSSICIGQSASFNISFTGIAPYTYSYSNGSQTFTPAPVLGSSTTISVTPNDSTTYTLISVTDAHCSGTVSGSAVVNVNPLPTPVISGNNIICDGTVTIFNAGNGYVNYLWSTGETTQTILYGIAGTYTVTVTDINTCVNSTSQALIVNETPVAVFTNDSSLTCEIPIINFFNGSSFPTGSTFQWDFGDGSQSDLENPSHSFATPGTYPISLLITSADGCSNTLTQDVDITFYPLPVAEFKLNPDVASVFNSTVNFVDQSQNAITWSWDFGDGAKTSEQSPKHYYDKIGKFKATLVITSIAGCVSQYTQEVLITPFYVPNAFSPNADGINDVFFDAGYIMDVASYDMAVWNRWGEKVFSNNNYKTFWNGFDKNGKEMPQGVYVYAIKVFTHSGKPYEFTGSVTLVR